MFQNVSVVIDKGHTCSSTFKHRFPSNCILWNICYGICIIWRNSSKKTKCTWRIYYEEIFNESYFLYANISCKSTEFNCLFSHHSPISFIQNIHTHNRNKWVWYILHLILFQRLSRVHTQCLICKHMLVALDAGCHYAGCILLHTDWITWKKTH